MFLDLKVNKSVREKKINVNQKVIRQLEMGI